MSKYQIETDIHGFIDRWLERTWTSDTFIPANAVWGAMLHSAGLPPDRKSVWGMNRQSAFEYMREEMGLASQQNRYYRPAGSPRGYPTGCYESLKLTQYALDALKAPLVVRPKVSRRVRAMV